MCRSTDHHRIAARLKIKAFFVRFSGPESRNPTPESLTLLYLPRIDGKFLEIDGARVRPGAAAAVALHRVKAAPVFGSRERVVASDGARFEVYLREEKVVEGIFRRGGDGEWRLECRCTVEGVAAAAAAAEICVDVEGQGAVFERVVLRERRKKKRGFLGLKEIPEGQEVEEDDSGGCGCCSSEEDDGGCGGDGGEEEVEMEMEMEVEGLRWAVDLGIWAVCLGVGLLVSRAAHSKTLRPKRII